MGEDGVSILKGRRPTYLNRAQGMAPLRSPALIPGEGKHVVLPSHEAVTYLGARALIGAVENGHSVLRKGKTQSRGRICNRKRWCPRRTSGRHTVARARRRDARAVR